MDSIRKINLKEETGSEEPKIESRMSKRRRIKFKAPGKKVFIVLGVVALFVVVSLFLIILPAQRVYKSAMLTKAQAQIAADALKKQNIEIGSVELAKTKTSLEQTQKELKSIGYIQFIPLAGGYYGDADHLINAGFHGINAAGIILESVKPYADVLGLKGQGSFVMGSAEQRIQTAVLTMGKITPRIDEVVASLTLAQKEIDKVDPNHYPELFGGKKIKTQLSQLKTLSDVGVEFANEARPLIKVLPSLLGESKEKRYLVLFQNDKELRPTGGFITAYAIFKIDKGVISVERSDDIYKLDDSIRNKPKAPEPILKYLPKVPTLNLRDSNLSPDFIESMKQFNTLYDTATEKVKVDGIIALDTHVLVSVLKILDDQVQVSGITFTTKNDKRCNCPQVIYELEDNISRPVGYIKTDRKGLLGDLLFALMQKAFKSSPKVYWGPLVQDLISKVNEKHVMFYLYDKDAQSGIDALNASGRMKAFDGDYLHINEANFGGDKANLFVKEAVQQDISVKSDRTITKKITINYKNPQPPSDCNLERGNLCLNSPLRNWVRIYVPKGSKLIDSTGSEVKVTTYEEFGKTVFEGFLIIKPLGAATLSLSYQLPFKLADDSILPLYIQKQPGTGGNEYTISVNGKTVQEFPLITDKEIKLKP